MIRFLLFDLDETLYPRRTGMFREVGERIHRYMERMGLPPEEVPRLRREYYTRYGTTLRGLQLHHNVNADEYLDFVHDLDVSRYLRPDPALDAALSRLPQEKVIFTNASAEYARRVLRALGVERHFSRIFGIRALRYHCKPDPLAFRIVLDALSATPTECLLIDDNPRNIRAAQAIGMPTILVGPPPEDDLVGPRIDEIAQVEEAVRNLREEFAHPPGM